MKNEKVLTLVEGAVMVALATVLSIYGAGACGNFQKIRNARSDWRKRYGYGSAPCVPLYKRSADIRLIRGAVERLYRKRALSLQPAL